MHKWNRTRSPVYDHIMKNIDRPGPVLPITDPKMIKLLREQSIVCGAVNNVSPNHHQDALYDGLLGGEF